jgi:nucleoid-associated protein YgaU
MSKEAKIGLSVILSLLVLLGGVVVWKLKSGTAPAVAQGNGNAKEKSPAESKSKAGAASKSESPRDAKESPKVLNSTAGQPPERENGRDLFSDISEYRRQRQATGEAAAIPPPPARTPDPAATEMPDPNDRYSLNRRYSAVPNSDPMGPPSAAAAAAETVDSGGLKRGGSFGNRSAEGYRLQDNPLATGNVPADVDRSAPAPNYRENPLAGHDAYDRGPNASRIGDKREPGEAPPNRNATLASAQHLRGTRSYTAVEGDTLFDIARCELGKASRWVEIYELNQSVLGMDIDNLVPGTELALPQDAAPDPVTRRPSGGLRR